jgi:hypothetical protein
VLLHEVERPILAVVEHLRDGLVDWQQAKVGANAVPLCVIVRHQPPLQQLVIRVADACTWATSYMPLLRNCLINMLTQAVMHST